MKGLLISFAITIPLCLLFWLVVWLVFGQIEDMGLNILVHSLGGFTIGMIISQTVFNKLDKRGEW